MIIFQNANTQFQDNFEISGNLGISWQLAPLNMQQLKSPSFKMSTQNLLLSVASIRIESTDGNFWHTWKSNHSHSHCHVYSSHSHSHFWHICVPIPMGFPWKSHSHAHLYTVACSSMRYCDEISHDDAEYGAEYYFCNILNKLPQWFLWL